MRKTKKKAPAGVTLSRELYARIAQVLMDDIRVAEQNIPGCTPAPDIPNQRYIEESHRDMAVANREMLRDECAKLVRLLDLQDALWTADTA